MDDGDDDKKGRFVKEEPETGPKKKFSLSGVRKFGEDPEDYSFADLTAHIVEMRVKFDRMVEDFTEVRRQVGYLDADLRDLEKAVGKDLNDAVREFQGKVDKVSEELRHLSITVKVTQELVDNSNWVGRINELANNQHVRTGFLLIAGALAQWGGPDLMAFLLKVIGK